MQSHSPTVRSAALVVLVWVALTMGVEFAAAGSGAGIDERAAGGPLWGVAAAGAFALIVVMARGWRSAVGLVAPRAGTRRLALPATVAVIVMAGIAFAEGLPAGPTLTLLVLNTALVGLSEELAFRGILLPGLRGALGTGRAVAISAVVFGVVHSLNGVLTGDFASAGAQSVLAMGMGVWTAGLRLRTGSLLAPIVLHAVWDLALIAALVSESPTAPVGVSLVSLVAIVGLTIHGVTLVRAQLREEREGEAAGPEGAAAAASA